MSPVVAVAVGMLGLAAAMGIGRFAFTPLMPLMQAHSDLSLAQGGWLAAANYAGYLAGALWCVSANPSPGAAARVGLAGVALSTLAMGLTGEFKWWLIWRFVAGVASALALVGISAWALPLLARGERAHWAGWVFSGVGAGILAAGIVSLVIAVRGIAPSTGWLLLGAAATLILALTWRGLSASQATPTTNATTRTERFTADAWLLIGCYGIFGFGYIIPATYLPSLARHLLADPAVFGWTWPVFGVAAAASTAIASLILRRARAAPSVGDRPGRHGGRRRCPGDCGQRRDARVCGDRHRRHVHGPHDGGPAGGASRRGERRTTPDRGDDGCVRDRAACSVPSP